jgi:hypothetical protein
MQIALTKDFRRKRVSGFGQDKVRRRVLRRNDEASVKGSALNGKATQITSLVIASVSEAIQPSL